MKRKFISLLALSLVLALITGCSSGNGGNDKDKLKESDLISEEDNNANSKEEKAGGSGTGETYKIGVVQHLAHPALDQAYEGFKDRLDELGVDCQIEYQNSQGEVPNGTTIVSSFLSNDVDLIYAIATPAAQSAQKATSDVPIIFNAVTDPVEAGLVESDERSNNNVTGVSDLAPIDKQLDIFKEIDPKIETIGIIYNTAESNSQTQVEEAKKSAQGKGLEIEAMGITQVADIPQACDALMPKVDGIYTLTDNMVASSISVVADKAKEYKIPLVGAEEAHIEGGGLITDGVSYYNLGRQAGDMAKEILVDGKKATDIPVERAEETKKVYNPETLEALGLDKNLPVFKDAEEVEKK